MRWHGWKKDGKWMGTYKKMGNGWKIWKLDGHGQVSWWSLYCLAHVQMLLHMFALTSESPVLLFSLSLILITAHPARRTEWSTSDKANAHPVQWCGVLLVPSSGLPCENSCCTEHISKRTWWGKSQCDTRATNPAYIWKYCNPRWAGQYAVRNSIQKDPFATQTVQLPLLWSDAMSLRPHVKRPRYGDPCWEMGDPPMFCMFFRQGDKPWYFGEF